MAAAPIGLLAQHTPAVKKKDPPTAVLRETASAPDLAAGAPTLSAAIAGTVLDTSGAEVQGADVVLAAGGGAKVREQQTGSNGEFDFRGLPPGQFELKVTGPGLGTVSRNIQLHAGDFRIVSKLRLPMMTAASFVRVVADPETIAEQQVHIAEQQRVMGVFPNFYSTYDWNAPPMMAKQKFQLALRSLVDPVTFFSVGTVAGIEQYNNNFPEYGQGTQGYAKRYSAAYANDVVGRILGNALLPSIFHQDPRYFYRGSGSRHSRLLYALAAAVIARGDNGHWEPNYSHLIGSFATGGISNLYYPSGSRGAVLIAVNGAVGIASYAGTNVLREFVLKRFTTRAK